jgi:murein DD-endopeptidase
MPGGTGDSSGMWIALIAVIGVTLAGCASSLPVYDGMARQPVPEAGSTQPSPSTRPQSGARSATGLNPVGSEIVRHALAMIGTPYRYGGASPRGFDCSGLVQYAYRQIGISVPRTTGQQFAAARRIDRRDAQPGDLLFFRFTRTVSHVGIYLGDGQFVHAPTSGRNVEVISLEQPFYRNHFISVGRLHTRT